MQLDGDWACAAWIGGSQGGIRARFRLIIMTITQLVQLERQLGVGPASKSGQAKSNSAAPSSSSETVATSGEATLATMGSDGADDLAEKAEAAAKAETDRQAGA